MSPCSSPLIYSFALTGSLLPLTGQSTLIYSLIYRWYILWGRGFFPSLIYYEGGYLVAAKMCSIYRIGVRRRWKKANACLYILSYIVRRIPFVRTFSTPQCFPHLWYVAQEVLAVLSLLGKCGLSLGAKYWRWQGRLRGAR